MFERSSYFCLRHAKISEELYKLVKGLGSRTSRSTPMHSTMTITNYPKRRTMFDSHQNGRIDTEARKKPTSAFLDFAVIRSISTDHMGAKDFLHRSKMVFVKSNHFH